MLLPSSATEGPPLYETAFPQGFLLFVEGRPGPSGLDVGTRTFHWSPFDPAVRPDLEILSSRSLGNGSPAPCDNSAPELGGVPAVDPPTFALERTVSDAVNDFACRFRAFDRSQFPCTQDAASHFAFASPLSTVQFCTLVSEAFSFPLGETLLTVRLRDSGGNPGPPAQIRIRVARSSSSR